MLKIAPVLLLLPLVALPLAALPALAALSPQQGLTILAKAHVADGRCKFLSKAERRELGNYRARAELASSQLMSQKKAEAAIAKGTAQGQAAACNERTRTDIIETLVAARAAIAEADGAEPDKQQPAVTVDPVDKMLPGRKDKAVALAAYRALVKPYFLDLRCKHLSGRKARNYYEAIKDLQKATIGRHGATAVAAAQARAQREAKSVKCGAASQQIARSGYAAMMGH